MFLVNDSISDRHEQIRALDPGIGVILVAADFEWTLRRAILALGTQPTQAIRKDVLGKVSRLEHYKDAWAKEVLPQTEKRLTQVVANWVCVLKAYRLRNRLVHGGKGSVGEEYARERMNCLLAASGALNDFAEERNQPLYGRAIRRLKTREARAFLGEGRI